MSFNYISEKFSNARLLIMLSDNNNIKSLKKSFIECSEGLDSVFDLNKLSAENKRSLKDLKKSMINYDCFSTDNEIYDFKILVNKLADVFLMLKN